MSLVIEERYDQVRQLIDKGKERGYLLYDEVNDMLPAQVRSSEEIDDLLATRERIRQIEAKALGKPPPLALAQAPRVSRTPLARITLDPPLRSKLGNKTRA